MDIAKLLDNTKEIVLPVVAEREGSIVAYRRILMRMIRAIRKAVNETVLPAYSSGIVPDGSVMDIRERKILQFNVVNTVASVSVDTATEEVKLLFDDEAKTHLLLTARAIKKGTGLDVSPALKLSGDEIDDLVRLYIKRNAALIKSLADETVYRVEQAVFQAKIDRTNYKDLTVILQEQFKLSASRARLIAYDQLASINSDFTESRHKAVGIKRYRWRTRRDGRTRPLHVQLDGNEYEWGKPTGSENGLPPGKEIRCRCTAVAILPASPEAVARNEKLREELTLSNNKARAEAKRRRAQERAGAL